MKTFLFIVFATIASLFVLTMRSYKFNQSVFSAALPILPTYSSAAASNPTQTITVDSPDGLKTLTMKKQETKDLITYYFSTSGKSDAARQLIFNKTENLSQNLSIPYNTWSPDNAYVFLKEVTPTADNYYIFNASGNYFSDGSQYLNLQEFFKQKLPNYILADVTGWAGPDLLIVNTKTDKGTLGSSFWFIISSRSFLQLSSYFY